MPIYEARSLDVNGNPVDGYEVNDTRSLGEVYVQPASLFDDDMTADAAGWSDAIIAALVDRKWLSVNAPRMLEAGELELEFNDREVTISEFEEAFVAQLDDALKDRFLEMVPVPRPTGQRRSHLEDRLADQLEEGEELGEQGGHRPIIALEEQWTTDQIRDGKHQVWEGRVLVPAAGGNMTPDEHEILIVVMYDEEGARLGIDVTVLSRDGMTDPDHVGADDSFEWPLADWQRSPTLGFDPLTSEELEPTKQQLEEILVSLDAYLEKL